MTDVTRRTALIGGATLLTGAAAFVLTPRRRDGDAFGAPLDKLVPETLGAWRSRVDPMIVLPESDVESRFYDKTLSRTYAAPGLPEVMLAIAHGGAHTTSWSVHRPEACYPASGFALSGKRQVSWQLAPRAAVPGRLLTATRGERIEQIGYWRRIADGFPKTSNGDRLLALRRQLGGYIPDGMLVRMSIITTDTALADATFARFAEALVRHSAPEGRRMMLGSLAALVA